MSRTPRPQGAPARGGAPGVGIAAGLLSLALLAAPGRAQELPLCTAPEDAGALRVVPAASGGAIFVWVDRRDTTTMFPNRLYAQRVDDSGGSLWVTDGVALAAASGDQLAPAAVADDSGGVIVVWVDNRAYPAPSEVYAQRLDDTGAPRWGASGLLVAGIPARGFWAPPALAPDGAGGAWVVWETEAGPTGVDLFAQRINALGTPLLGPLGLLLCGFAGDQTKPRAVLASDATLIAAWEDHRSTTAASDPYVQKLSPTGVPVWTPGGVPVTTSLGLEEELALVADYAGGAVLVWQDTRNSPGRDIYAQRIGPSGLPLWDGPEPGPDLLVCGAPSDQLMPRAARVGTAGTVVGWLDRRGPDWDIFAQAVGDLGTPLWAPDGQVVSVVSGAQWLWAVAGSAAGDALFFWHDERDSAGVSEIYGQRLTPGGLPLWGANGTPLAEAPLAQRCPQGLLTGPDQALVAWEDGRTGVDWDLFVRPITLSTLAAPTEAVARTFAVSVRPNPSRGGTEIRVRLAGAGSLAVTLYDTRGRLARRLFAGVRPAGEHSFFWDGRGERGDRVPPGVYFLRASGAGAGDTGRSVAVRRVVVTR